MEEEKERRRLRVGLGSEGRRGGIVVGFAVGIRDLN